MRKPLEKLVKQAEVAFVPNYFVDISDYIGLKIRALQFYDEEMWDYPHIRSYNLVENLSKFRSSLVGIENAEAFCIERLIK
jgi:LmbE family N-acetylglucosaminyl deacetylase